MNMTVRELIQELISHATLDDQIALNDPKDPFIVTARIKVRSSGWGTAFISIKEGEE